MFPEDLCYLSGKYLKDYLFDVEICQRFARRNREKMAEILLDRTGITGGEWSSFLPWQHAKQERKLKRIPEPACPQKRRTKTFCSLRPGSRPLNFHP